MRLRRVDCLSLPSLGTSAMCMYLFNSDRYGVGDRRRECGAAARGGLRCFTLDVNWASKRRRRIGKDLVPTLSGDCSSLLHQEGLLVLQDVSLQMSYFKYNSHPKRF